MTSLVEQRALAFRYGLACGFCAGAAAGILLSIFFL